MRQRWVVVMILGIIVTVFLWLRFANIENSLFFFNDMGRDAWVLQQWRLTGKPPLLGPQTSALPFNQSAIYFYLLYPLFILSGQLSVSPLITSAILYLTAFGWCLYLARNDKKLTGILLVSYWLITIHPQYIIQNRFIWNPSLVSPFILVGLTYLYLLEQKESRQRMAGWAITMAVAVSLSYSIIPLLLAMIVWAFFRVKNKLYLVGSLIVSGLVINLPTIFFELRHGFLLTKSVLNKESPVQEGLGLATKLNNLGRFGVSAFDGKTDLLILMGLIIMALIILIKSKNKIIAGIFLLSTIVLLVAPISLQSHYVFGFLIVSFWLIGQLPKMILLPIMIIMTATYLQPGIINGYFRPAPRSVAQMESCFAKVCAKEKETMFVSVQSSYHPFHNGPEHRYLLRRAGCDVKEIETVPNSAEKMIVVVDGGGYDHGLTKYNELTMFGESKIVGEYKCQDNFGVVILKKGK